MREGSAQADPLVKNPAAGGGRWVEVPPERLVSWGVAFAQWHGGAAPDRPVTLGRDGSVVPFTAVGGAGAEGPPPFPPVPPGLRAADVAGEPEAVLRAAAEGLAAHAAAARTI